MSVQAEILKRNPTELISDAAVVSVQAEILKRNPTELISDAAVVLVRARNCIVLL